MKFVRVHPLISFFILAYGLSWGSFFALSGPFLFPFGSIIAALVVAGITGGSEGLMGILRRCTRWRVGPLWYAAALLVPIAIAAVSLGLNIARGAPSPPFEQIGPWYNVLLTFPMAMIDAPLWEDTGWRGFALPRFPHQRSQIINTLLLGVLLALWHLPIAVTGGGLVSVAAPYLITTVLSAVVTNWIYYNTRGSALLAIIYHASANTAGILFFNAYAGADLVYLYWYLAGANLIAAIAVIVIGPNKWFGVAEGELVETDIRDGKS